MLLCALALAIAMTAGCKGKTGAACTSAGDCADGHYCHQNTCMAGPETACGYLDRCIPKLAGGQAETLFGEKSDYMRRMVKESPNEAACESQLKLIKSINRMTVLHRACGPRVTTPP
jgi:hypothetical protein